VPFNKTCILFEQGIDGGLHGGLPLCTLRGQILKGILDNLIEIVLGQGCLIGPLFNLWKRGSPAAADVPESRTNCTQENEGNCPVRNQGVVEEGAGSVKRRDGTSTATSSLAEGGGGSLPQKTQP